MVQSTVLRPMVGNKLMSVLKKKWVFVEVNKDDPSFDSICTEDGEDVLGCSEWLWCEKETLIYIVELHNVSLGE